MNLSRALRYRSPASIAFVGSGGKTTALFQLAREIPPPVIVSVTTHLHIDQVALADHHFICVKPADLSQFEALPQGVTLVTGPRQADRTAGPDQETILQLKTFCDNHSLPILIEADGSRQLPLKAPHEEEPPIPDFAAMVVVVAGLSGLGHPLTGEYVHRPEIFGRLSGLAPGETVTWESLARELLHPQGGLKNIPANARRIALLNQADTPGLQSQGQILASNLLPAYQAVVVASLREAALHATFERTAGIILAAGEARRFQGPKQLALYDGKPFIQKVAETALASGLSPVVVVVGAYADQVESAIQDLAVEVVHNPHWQEGQSTSIQQGLSSLPKDIGSAVFLLSDQPQIKAPLIRALVERHARELAPILAPLVRDRRGNPILFDRDTFSDLMALKGDIGGRAIFSKYLVDYLPWHDESILVDIDIPGDLGQLVG